MEIKFYIDLNKSEVLHVNLICAQFYVFAIRMRQK